MTNVSFYETLTGYFSLCWSQVIVEQQERLRTLIGQQEVLLHVALALCSHGLAELEIWVDCHFRERNCVSASCSYNCPVTHSMFENAVCDAELSNWNENVEKSVITG
jgi:hypothetical protein